MKELSSYLTNLVAADGDFSLGRMKDNPGDDTGTGLTVQTQNDIYYALVAMILKYRTGGLSDADESETAPDFVQAIEEMIGARVNTIAEWSAATTYSTLGASVMRHGIQFVVVNNTGNLNKDPLLQPSYWAAVPRTLDLFEAYTQARVVRAHSTPLHDYNDALYQEYFSLGIHQVGGVDGETFKAWGVHLDGATVTASTELDDLLDAYFLQTTFAPGTPKVLKDFRETVDRAMGATGGEADTIGERQEDQMQGHWHKITYNGSTDVGANSRETNNTGGSPVLSGSVSDPGAFQISDPRVDASGNGTPRTGTETRAKSGVTGVPYIVIMEKTS
mgnify:CR=1 FL=1